MGHGRLDSSRELHGIGACDDVLDALLEDGLSEHGRGRGSVAGDVRRLAGDLLDHLDAHVLVGVLDLDLASDGHAVLGHGGRAEALGDDDVAAARPEGDLDGAGELVDSATQGVARLSVEGDLLGGHYSTTARMSDSSMIRYSSPSTLISVPA